MRPRDLPDPFERPASFVPAIDTAPPERRAPPVFDDPFLEGLGPSLAHFPLCKFSVSFLPSKLFL